MKKILHFTAGLCCFLLLPGWLLAQEKTIAGKVTDANLTPLQGVNIVINKTNRGTATDAEGKFSIPMLKQENYFISASHIGYLKKFSERGKPIVMR